MYCLKAGSRARIQSIFNFSRPIEVMKNIILASLMVNTFIAVSAEDRIPKFEVAPVEVAFSATFTGIQPDASHKSGDNLIYKFTGQVFGPGMDGQLQLEGFSGKTDRKTPWETLTELVNAYKRKDYEKIMSLYSKVSRDDLDAMLAGDMKDKYLNHIGKIQSAQIIAGFEYKGGFLVIYQAKGIGMSTCYMTQSKKKFLITAFKDDGPESWNLSLYFKFKPEPMKQPELITKMDSFEVSDSKSFSFRLSKPGNWLVVFKDKVGEGTLYNAQDGSNGDVNKEEGVMDVEFNSRKVSSNKDYTLYAVETNYPVTMVTETLIKNAMRFGFRVYKK